MTARIAVRWLLHGFLLSFAVWLFFVLTHDRLAGDGHPARLVFIPVITVLLSPFAGLNGLLRAFGFTVLEDIHQDYVVGILNCALWGVIALALRIALRGMRLFTTKKQNEN